MSPKFCIYVTPLREKKLYSSQTKNRGLRNSYATGLTAEHLLVVHILHGAVIYQLRRATVTLQKQKVVENNMVVTKIGIFGL